MTCREKLKQEHPEKIDSECFGGCTGCPRDYDYMNDPDYCKWDTGEGPELDKICRKCWDREIPETNNDIQKLADTFGLSYGEVESIVNSVQSKILTNINDDVTISFLPYKPGNSAKGQMIIKDSGNRREFETGAVRDIQEGKGRCDLLPLDVIANWFEQPKLDPYPERTEMTCWVLTNIYRFQETGRYEFLHNALSAFLENYDYIPTMFLEVSKHFEEGAKKYGEYNWQKGIPTHCYIDSAVRHYLKYLRGDTDEPHDRAFVWNILCCIWTCIHKPEMNDYRQDKDKTFKPTIGEIETMARNTRINKARREQLDSKGVKKYD